MDEKLDKLDRLYVKAQTLTADYEKFCSAGYTEDDLQSCIADIEEIKTACEGTGLELNAVCDSLLNVFRLPKALSDNHDILNILTSMQQQCQKAYLASICDEGTYRHVKLENYFNTANERTALIIYIVYPFLFPQAPLAHTNQQEARVMAELLKERGYNVDIVNTRYEDYIQVKDYALIIGSGGVFEELCVRKGQETLAIYYLTVSSPYFANVAEMQRLYDFWKRNHHRLPFERQIRTCLDLNALAQADAAVCIGNQWTTSTYEGMFTRLYPLDVSGFNLDTVPDFNADVSEMQRHFMWYGGAGPVRKGLDLCIEAFRKLPDLTLHIVGGLNTAFYDFYRKDIEEAENIYYYGFLNYKSAEFAEVCKTCAYCVSPSSTEGQSTSVLTAMHAGMIPVCTVQTGIDMEKCGGIWIEEIGVDALAALFERLSELPPDEVKRRRTAAFSYVRQNHTLESYRNNLSRILEQIMAERKNVES